MAGYRNKGTCITHSSRDVKNTNSFIFRAREEGQPHFSGFVVFDYSEYSGLRFVTPPIPDQVEELEVDFI